MMGTVGKRASGVRYDRSELLHLARLFPLRSVYLFGSLRHVGERDQERERVAYCASQYLQLLGSPTYLPIYLADVAGGLTGKKRKSAAGNSTEDTEEESSLVPNTRPESLGRLCTDRPIFLFSLGFLFITICIATTIIHSRISLCQSDNSFTAAQYLS